MVPLTGPFSASSALATTSWYQRGKFSDWGVRTAFGDIRAIVNGQKTPWRRVIRTRPLL